MTHGTKKSSDHDKIKAWVEERGGNPSKVKTEQEGEGILRIDFAGDDDDLDHITWDEFFKIFEDNNLAFIYQEDTAGGEASRFNKIVSR